MIKDIAKKYFDAWSSGNYDEVATYIADNIEFEVRSRFANGKRNMKREDWIEAIIKSPKLDNLEFLYNVHEGNTVAQYYTGKSRTMPVIAYITEFIEFDNENKIKKTTIVSTGEVLPGFSNKLKVIKEALKMKFSKK